MTTKHRPLPYAGHFVYPQWLPMLLSMPFLICASLLQLLIPFMVQVMTTYDEEEKKNMIQESISAFNYDVVGPILAPYIILYAPSFDVRLCGFTCMLLSNILFMYLCAFLGKQLAVRASCGARAMMVQELMVEVLNSNYPERVAAFESAQFTALISSSSESLYSLVIVTLMELFTNTVLAVGLIYSLVHIFSSLLTSIIKMLLPLLFVIAYQVQTGAKARDLGMKAHLTEGGAKAEHHNMIQHAELVHNSHCVDFLCARLDVKLQDTERANNNFDTHIHGSGALAGAFFNAVKIGLATTLCVFQHNKEVSPGEVNVFLMLVSWSFSCIKDVLHEKDHLQNQLAAIALMQAVRHWILHPEEYPLPSTQDEDTSTKDSSNGVVKGTVICSDDENSLVSLDSVTFDYPQPPEELAQFRRTSYTVNATISWQAKPHCITALYGPSGCGKSSSLRLLCGLLKPTSGVVHTHTNTRMLEQDHSMVFGSIAENILLERAASDAEGSSTEEKKKHAAQKALLKDAMMKAGCDSFVKDPFHTCIDNPDHPPFSGGQQQRIRLARVFADGDRCSLVLFDEPTTGLDDVSVELVLASIKEMRDVHHKTVIVATHDPRVAAISDDVVRL